MVQGIIQNATDQRKFTLVYNDFLESDLLTYYEKMVFIALKKYADNETMKAFPSLRKIHKITGISLSQVRRSIEHMEEMGIISVEHRTDEVKGYQSNIYTLYDYEKIWKAGSGKEIATVIDEIEERRMIELLTAKGYCISKEKGLVSEPAKEHAQAPINNNLSADKNSIATAKSQGEEYTMQDVQVLFDYSILMADYPEHEADLNVVFDILHEVLNTSKQTIRIGGEDKPKEVVKGKLMKLESYDIVYAIDKFHEQVHKIKNTRAYLLTILYHAREQSYLDLMNLGHRNGDF